VAPAVVTSESPFDVTALALDAYNNFAVFTGTVSFTTTDNDPAVVVPPPYTFTADEEGAHVFRNGFTLITEGLQTITVTDQATGISWTVNLLVQPGNSFRYRTNPAWTGPANVASFWLTPVGTTEGPPAKVVAGPGTEDEAEPLSSACATAPQRARAVPMALIDPGLGDKTWATSEIWVTAFAP